MTSERQVRILEAVYTRRRTGLDTTIRATADAIGMPVATLLEEVVGLVRGRLVFRPAGLRPMRRLLLTPAGREQLRGLARMRGG